MTSNITETAELTYAQLRRAAVDLYAEGGLAAVTLTALSRRTGASLRSVFEQAPDSDIMLADLTREQLLY